MRRGIILAWTAMALLALGCVSAPASPPPGGGYEVPRFGDKEEIWDLWHAADGHLVLEFVYRDAGHLLNDDFYDTQTKSRLFPTQARAMATDNAVKATLVKAAGFTKLRVNDMTAIPAGNMLLQGADHGPRCKPIPNFFTMGVLQAGREPVAFTLFVPYASPFQACNQPFSNRYGLVNGGFYAVAADGFLVNIYSKPYLAWFDWNGHSTFFNGRSDIIQVPYGDLSHALLTAKRNAAGAPQNINDTVDAVVGRYQTSQLNRKPHG